MSFATEESQFNNLIPALENLEIDRPISPCCSVCSSDGSCSSLEFVNAKCLQFSITSDELPIFSIRSLSPTTRSLSPVVADQMCISPVDFIESDENSDELLKENDDHMLLNDIHALIGTPDEKKKQRLNLETIFEDVLLETPPKQHEHKRLSFDSISRYVIDQQLQHRYRIFNQLSNTAGENDCLETEQTKQDDLC